MGLHLSCPNKHLPLTQIQLKLALRFVLLMTPTRMEIGQLCWEWNHRALSSWSAGLLPKLRFWTSKVIMLQLYCNYTFCGFVERMVLQQLVILMALTDH